MNKTFGWATPPNDVMQQYINKCKLFCIDDNEFNKFRRDKDYTKILEGGEFETGRISLEYIKINHSDKLKLISEKLIEFKENDVYGSPIIHNFEIFGNICPSTIKYVNNALDIDALIGDNNVRNILEVGGGYGGLCKVLSSLIDFEKYIMIDLPDAVSLCKKYLDHFDNIKNKIEYISCDDLDKIGNIIDVDLFISDSSLAECDIETQNFYVDNLLKKSKLAYLVYNTMHCGFTNQYCNIIDSINKDFKISEYRINGNIMLSMEKIYE
jgi:hypothetical protein